MTLLDMLILPPPDPLLLPLLLPLTFSFSFCLAFLPALIPWIKLLNLLCGLKSVNLGGRKKAPIPLPVVADFTDGILSTPPEDPCCI